MTPPPPRDRRKGDRRQEDRDLKNKLSDFDRLLTELRDLKETLGQYHEQNKEKLDNINTVNRDQLQLLETLTTAQGVLIFIGKAIAWIAGIGSAIVGIWYAIKRG